MSRRQIQFIRKIYTIDNEDVEEVIADTQTDIGKFLIYKMGEEKVKKLDMIIGADTIKRNNNKGIAEMAILFTINASDGVTNLLERDMRLPYLKLYHAD